MDSHDEDIAVLFDDATIARIDAVRAKLARPSHEVTREDALREIILRALDRAEQDPTFLRNVEEPRGPMQ